MALPQTELEEDEFGNKLMDALNNTALGMGIAIGDYMGLFTAMSTLDEPSTSNEIASKAGLNERYVREWLGIMVTGRVVIANKGDSTFNLPKSYAKFLTPGFESIAHQFKWLFMLTGVQKQLRECMKAGGGIHYSSYPEFHEWMNEYSVKRHEALLLQQHIPSINGLTEKLHKGIKCLDIGCGMGSPSLILAAKFPNSEFHGYDMAEDTVRAANREAEKRGLTNAKFFVKDVATIFDCETSFDLVTSFDAIHDQANPSKVMDGVYNALKPGGWFSLVDVKAHSHPADNVGMPMSSMKYAESLFHCMPVSLFFKDGAGLGTCWGIELAQTMLHEAGFSKVDVIDIPEDDYNIHILCVK